MHRFTSAAATAVLLLGVGGIIAAAPTPSHAQFAIGVSVNIAPPPLPVYDQPPIPAYGYIWTPGYWAWDPDIQDYYWVPGTWVEPPQVGLLWTPGFWGWNNGVFVFNDGYWGPHIGFYGGVNYGFGYSGVGYEGGYWQGGRLFYNSTVNNITNVRIETVYQKTVVNDTTTHVSFNGGEGGVHAEPTPAERQAASEPHVRPTADQLQQRQVARSIPANRASANHGRPAVAATPRPGAVDRSAVDRRAPGAARPVSAAPGARPMAPKPAAAVRPQAPKPKAEPKKPDDQR